MSSTGTPGSNSNARSREKMVTFILRFQERIRRVSVRRQAVLADGRERTR